MPGGTRLPRRPDSWSLSTGWLRRLGGLMRIISRCFQNAASSFAWSTSERTFGLAQYPAQAPCSSCRHTVLHGPDVERGSIAAGASRADELHGGVHRPGAVVGFARCWLMRCSRPETRAASTLHWCTSWTRSSTRARRPSARGSSWESTSTSGPGFPWGARLEVPVAPHVPLEHPHRRGRHGRGAARARAHRVSVGA
jgi:hypothetical protein